MKALFIFDAVLFKEDSNFIDIALTYDFFKNRYLSFYDEITVSTRMKSIEEVKGNIDGYKVVNGENVKVVPIENYKEIPDAFFKNSKIKKELLAVIKQSDIVIIRMPSMLGILACQICKKLNKKYQIEVVACPWDGYMNHTNPIGKIVAPIMFFKIRKCIKEAPKVLYVTNKFLQSRYPTKGEQITCSDVVIEKAPKDILEKRLDKIEKSASNEIIKLCTVANVAMKYKGHEFVIEAISKLNEKSTTKYKYYIVGEGNTERLQEIVKKYKVEDDVIFCGSLPHKEVFNVLEDIDIYIQPSLTEAMSRALIEAMSRACPCIASNAGGNPELLKTEMIFEKKNSDKIVEILNSLNKEKLKEFAKYSFEKSKEFDEEILEKKRREFYR
jgi:glycosyltransferase involved in cell wall biosynthesis